MNSNEKANVSQFREILRKIINTHQIKHPDVELKIEMQIYLNPLNYDGIDSWNVILFSKKDKFDYEKFKSIPGEKNILFEYMSSDINEVITKLQEFVMKR